MADKPKLLSKEEKQDVQLASSLILAPLTQDDGVGALGELVQSAADLPSAVADAVFSALGTARSKLEEKGIAVSGKIWTAAGGVLDVVIKNLAQILAGALDVDEAASPDFMQAVKENVLDAMEAEDGMGQQQQGAPVQAGPPNLLAPPQGGMPNGQPAQLP